MKATFIEQISRAVEATMITPSGDYTWFGQRSGAPLRQRLYSDFYLSGGAVASRRERTWQPVPDTATFVAMLEAANAGIGTWSPGWTEIASAGDTLVVHDDRLDLAIWVRPEDVCRQEDGAISLRLPAQLPDWSPGFWLALGNTPSPNRDERLVRFYWNLRPDGAAMLVSQATTRLNDAGIPFRLKLLANPSRYTRCDAGVLYLPGYVVTEALPVIQAIYGHVHQALKPAVPALTRPLAPGLATADDPGPAESFGSQRCRLLADAIVAAAEAELTRLPDRVAFVGEHLAENGVSLEHPYLCAASAIPAIGIASKRAPTVPAIPHRPTADYRQVAVAIARQIANDALWHDDTCAWLGPTGTFERGQSVYGTLGPDLYNGSAGIALVLGEVFRVTDEATFASTALGGIRHALAHAEEVPPTSIAGLYTGLPGIAFAAARLAGLLDRPELLASARQLLAGIEIVPSREHDLLSGTAGALLAVLLLDRAAPDETLLAQAVVLGEQLLASAHCGANGYSWRSGRRALTGMSHGASGIGIALLELAAATGQERFCAAARAAFRWEHHSFNPDDGNWPDLRHVTGRLRRSTPLPAGVSWCHGAPGIGLARLRAATLLDDPALRDEARIALTTTQRWTAEAMASGDESFCLCHGLAGNADILLDGYAALGDESLRDTAAQVAEAGIARYAGDPRCWPVGTYDGSTPGLMLGLAGIGYFYLRLAAPTLPSVLLPVDA